MTRTPGLRGRLPVKPPAERFPLSYLSDYLRQPLPAPVYPIDVTGGIAPNEWAMLANGPDPTCTTHPNGVGDCGFAARQHARMAKAASYRQTETWETSDQLVAEYLRYDHGQDVGVNLADVLLTWYRKGIIKAFAPVDHTDPAAIDSAMARSLPRPMRGWGSTNRVCPDCELLWTIPGTWARNCASTGTQ